DHNLDWEVQPIQKGPESSQQSLKTRIVLERASRPADLEDRAIVAVRQLDYIGQDRFDSHAGCLYGSVLHAHSPSSSAQLRAGANSCQLAPAVRQLHGSGSRGCHVELRAEATYAAAAASHSSSGRSAGRSSANASVMLAQIRATQTRSATGSKTD